jgi:hypothetical protein
MNDLISLRFHADYQEVAGLRTDMDATKYHKRIKDIGLILKDLLKVIKVVSMYPEDNPLPQSLRRTFAERLEEVILDHGEVSVEVHRDHMEIDSETVFVDRSKEESLAGLFFQTGITKITFKEGLDVEEIYKLLDVIKHYMNNPGQNLDLVALIWEAGISRFGLTTVEDIALAEYDGDINIGELIGLSGSDNLEQMSADDSDRYNGIFNLGRIEHIQLHDQDDPGQGSASGHGVASQHVSLGSMPDEDDSGRFVRNVLDDDDGDDNLALKTAEAAAAMGFGDIDASASPLPRPDTTLILNDELRLSEEEEAHIKSITREDADFDPYESTAELLKEMLHQETDLQGFNETVSVCEKVLTEFVGIGKLSHAGWVLEYILQLEERIQHDKPQWADRLKEVITTMGSRDRLKVLAETLNRLPELGQFELRRYLGFFGWESLSSLTDLLGELQHQIHREALCDFLAERGRQHSHLLAKGLTDKRWYVVRNATIVMCRIGDHNALANLRRVLSHTDRRVRLSLVQQLKDCRNVEALDLLKACVRDRDPEIRKEAVNSIVAWRGAAAFDAITDIMSDDSFVELASEDKQAVLTAYSKLGGDQAIGYLVSLITKPNLLRDGHLAEMRIAAFEALTYNRSDRCERALIKLASSWRTQVKHGATEALQRRRERIFGGDDA